MENKKKIIVVAWIVTMIFAIISLSNKITFDDVSDHYDIKTIEASYVTFSADECNVRAEPLATYQYYTEYASTQAGAAGFGVNTVSAETKIGEMKNDGVYTICVSKVYYPVNCDWDDTCRDGGDAENGPFIGIAVDEIVENAFWMEAFPNVENDPDGIVWISMKTGVRYE